MGLSKVKIKYKNPHITIRKHTYPFFVFNPVPTAVPPWASCSSKISALVRTPKVNSEEQAVSFSTWMSNLIQVRQSANYSINTVLHLQIKEKVMINHSPWTARILQCNTNDRENTKQQKPNISKLTCVVYPLNSCPRVKGVASWVWVRPILTISLNSIDCYILKRRGKK